MPSNSLQTSLQAVNIYRSVINDPSLDLAISSNGDIRIATIFDRAINHLSNIFSENTLETRKTLARKFIYKKFEREVQFFSQGKSTEKSETFKVALDKIINNDSIDTAITELNDSMIKTALTHIRDIHSLPLSSKREVRLAWRATSEFIAEGKRVPDIEFTRTVVSKTLEWKTKFNVDEKSAYRLAFNAASLHRKHGIQIATACDILQVAGRLHQRHNINKDEALRLAIDLHIPLQKIGADMDGIEKAKKYLRQRVPAFIELKPVTQISAAVCYLQLIKINKSNEKSITEINQRIKDMATMQSVMPKGCVINQIHQGSHIRGHINVNEARMKKFADKVATLTEYPTFKKNAVTIKLPDEYQYFEDQFVKDFVRGFRYELRQNGVQDTEFLKLESKCLFENTIFVRSAMSNGEFNWRTPCGPSKPVRAKRSALRPASVTQVT